METGPAARNGPAKRRRAPAADSGTVVSRASAAAAAPYIGPRAFGSVCPPARLKLCSGGEEARTPGLFNAIEALSQLSYTPTTALLYTNGSARCKSPWQTGVRMHWRERVGIEPTRNGSNPPPTRF